MGQKNLAVLTGDRINEGFFLCDCITEVTVRQDSNTAAASASTAIFHGYPASVPLSFPRGKLAKCMIYVFRIQLKWSVRHRRMDYPKRLPDM